MNNLRKFKTEILRLEPQNDKKECHFERSEESNLSYKPLNILFISTHLPREGVSAGAGRVFSMLKSISRYHNITLITLATEEEKKDQAPLEGYCKKVCILDRNGSGSHFGIFPLYPPWILSEYGNPRMRSIIKKELKSGNYDIVQFEFLEGCCNLPYFCRIPSVLTHHEIKSRLFHESFRKGKGFFARAKLFLKWLLMLRFELQSCSFFTALVTINEEEGELFRRYLSRSKNVTIPMGVDCNYFSPQGIIPESNSLVYVGYFGHNPNVDAVIYLVKEILPLIRRKIPHVKVYIVGSYPPQEIINLRQEEGVIVTGRVPDIRPYLAMASVFIAPIRQGGGMRGKILEAMAMGKAVVTTLRGASGLKAYNDKEIIIAEGAEEFAGKTVEMMQNREKRERIGKAALNLVRTHYDWEMQADKYLQLYQEIVQRKI